VKDIICEVDRIDQIEPALQAGATRLLLDNMEPPILREAVALVAGRVDGAADTHAFAAALSLAEIAGDPAAALASPERYLEAAGSVLASRLAEPA